MKKFLELRKHIFKKLYLNFNLFFKNYDIFNIPQSNHFHIHQEKIMKSEHMVHLLNFSPCYKEKLKFAYIYKSRFQMLSTYPKGLLLLRGLTMS